MNPKDLTSQEMHIILGNICGMIALQKERGISNRNRPVQDSIMRKFMEARPEFQEREPLMYLDQEEQGDEFWANYNGGVG